jgi:hypothetical protein
VRDILGDNAPQLRVGEPSKPAAEPPKPTVPRPIDPPKPTVARPIDPPKPNGTRAIDPPPLAKVVLDTPDISVLLESLLDSIEISAYYCVHVLFKLEFDKRDLIVPLVCS